MQNRLKITFLLFLLAIFTVTMGSVIGGKSGVIFAFIMALGMTFFSCWFSGKIVPRILPMYTNTTEFKETAAWIG
ncbi:MAG: hypothetical protein WA140_13470 [Geobacteraceae bacterium]